MRICHLYTFFLFLFTSLSGLRPLWQRRALVLISAVLMGHLSYGQSSFSASYAAVHKQFAYGDKCDTARINALNTVLADFVALYPDSVLYILPSVATICNECNFVKGKVEVLRLKGNAYESKRMYDTALLILNEALLLSAKTDDPASRLQILNNIGIVYTGKGNYMMAYEKYYEAIKLAESINDKEMVGAMLNNLANIYYYQKKYDDAELYYRKVLNLALEISDTLSIAIAYNNLGEINLVRKLYPDALRYLGQSLEFGKWVNNAELRQAAKVAMAQVYGEMDSIKRSDEIYNEVIAEAEQTNDALYTCYGYLGKAKMIFRHGNLDSSLALARKGITFAEKIGQRNLVRDGFELLADIYAARGEGMRAYESYRRFKQTSDSLSNLELERSSALQEASYEYTKKELEFQRKNLQQRWLIFSGFAGVFTLGIILFISARSRRRLNKVINTLHERNEEIEKQRAAIEDTLKKLQSTQAQLVHAEKMASLGELTAGIAHEIQNPLNFVNNFSEVTGELLSELLEELDKGNREEIDLIAADMKQNLEKILLHGKRADGIVKSMLNHSRNSAGRKEPTDLNALCNEYLNLTYHGLRAKDKNFNAKLKTNFDPALPKLLVSPQDMGRVILNLINNAFYAVNERWKIESKQTDSEFQPLVTVGTQYLNDHIEIKVGDNGAGIPPHIIEKIFQPFFTTKPAGSGTGLGLSLSYDIVQAHGGEIKVNTREGEGTEFLISLPVA